MGKSHSKKFGLKGILNPENNIALDSVDVWGDFDSCTSHKSPVYLVKRVFPKIHREDYGHVKPISTEHVHISAPRVANESRPKQRHQYDTTEYCCGDPSEIDARLRHVTGLCARVHIMNGTPVSGL